jgi:hypothetical protein
MSQELWVENLWSLIRRDLWGSMPDEFFGPVGEKAIRALIGLAVANPEFGFADVSRLLDPDEQGYRARILAPVDAELCRIIERQVMPMIKGGDNAALFVTGKFAPFDSPQFRAATSGDGPRIPLEEALAGGISVLGHAPAAQLGDVPARTLISGALRRAWAHLTIRDGGPRLNLILDEWQRYASDAASTMLAESRKYGARLLLANQVLTQLDPALRNTVLGNTGAVACYRMSPADAATMDGLFPSITTHRLQTLPRHTLAVTTFESDQVVAGPAPHDKLHPGAPFARQLIDLGLCPEPGREPMLARLAGALGALLAARSQAAGQPVEAVTTAADRRRAAAAVAAAMSRIAACLVDMPEVMWVQTHGDRARFRLDFDPWWVQVQLAEPAVIRLGTEVGASIGRASNKAALMTCLDLNRRLVGVKAYPVADGI